MEDVHTRRDFIRVEQRSGFSGINAAFRLFVQLSALLGLSDRLASVIVPSRLSMVPILCVPSALPAFSTKKQKSSHENITWTH